MSFFVKIRSFLKKEPVLSISFLLAVVAMVVFRPGISTAVSAIDWRTISILFCLMISVKAFQSKNLLDAAANAFLKLCHTKRSLYFLLVFFVFFVSMLVTNDVALLTFVPLTILLCNRAHISALVIVVLETLAANLGSCITPMGNPQNLYLYSYYGFGAGEFFGLTLKIGVPSVLLLTLFILFATRDNSLLKGLEDANSSIRVTTDWKFFVYAVDFVLCLLTVFRVLPFEWVLGATVVIMLICDLRLFAKVDYSLLFTFAFLFIFTGTLSSVEAFSLFLQKNLASPLATFVAGIGASQFISNVPAAILLSGFTSRGAELLLAVNVGGLGTLIASMASVISFKIYKASEENRKKTGALSEVRAGGETVADVVVAGAATETVAGASAGVVASAGVAGGGDEGAGGGAGGTAGAEKKKMGYFGFFTLSNFVLLAILAPLVWILNSLL